MLLLLAEAVVVVDAVVLISLEDFDASSCCCCCRSFSMEAKKETGCCRLPPRRSMDSDGGGNDDVRRCVVMQDGDRNPWTAARDAASATAIASRWRVLLLSFMVIVEMRESFRVLVTIIGFVGDTTSGRWDVECLP